MKLQLSAVHFYLKHLVYQYTNLTICFACVKLLTFSIYFLSFDQRFLLLSLFWILCLLIGLLLLATLAHVVPSTQDDHLEKSKYCWNLTYRKGISNYCLLSKNQYFLIYCMLQIKVSKRRWNMSCSLFTFSYNTSAFCRAAWYCVIGWTHPLFIQSVMFINIWVTQYYSPVQNWQYG